MERLDPAGSTPNRCCGGTVTELIMGVLEVAAAAFTSSYVGILSDVVMTTFAGDELEGVCAEVIPFNVGFGGMDGVDSCLRLNDTLGLLVIGAGTDLLT